MTEQNINKASLYHFLISLKISCLSFFFWLHWAFMALRGCSLAEGSGGCSPLPCSPASLSCRAPALAARASGVHAGAHRLGPSGTWARGLSVGTALGLGCSAACGILPDRGSNPCPLHWQADPHPLCHSG